MRHTILIGLSCFLLAVGSGLGQAALAQNQPPNPAPTRYCWVDAKTGEPYPSLHLPAGSDTRVDPADPHHAFDDKTGQNLFQQPDGTWIDAATGQPYPTVDLPAGFPDTRVDPADPNHAYDGQTGQNLFRVPCPPPPTQTTGVYLGGEILKNYGKVGSEEQTAMTGVVTNQFSDTGDPLGFGLVVGDNILLNKIIVGPFVSFDWLTQSINHTFAAGSFLGTTTHWNVLAGAKVGALTANGTFLYGLAGVGWLNHDLNINFGRGATSNNITTTGYALGGGAEFQPGAWQSARVPLAVLVQYQHTKWQDAAEHSGRVARIQLHVQAQRRHAQARRDAPAAKVIGGLKVAGEECT